MHRLRGQYDAQSSKQAYECRYCTSLSAFTDENYYKAPPLRYRHRKIEVEGDKFSVLHTTPASAISVREVGLLTRENRIKSLDDKLR